MGGQKEVTHVLDAIDQTNASWFKNWLLHSRFVHLTLFGLLLLDGLIVLASGVLESEYLSTQVSDCKKYVDACAPKNHRRLWQLRDAWRNSFESETSPRWLNEAASGEHTAATTAANHGSMSYTDAAHGSYAASGSSHGSAAADPICSGPASHGHYGNHTFHDIESVLTYISIGILAFFLLENLCLMYQLKSDYFKPMFVLDFFVICSSLAIEILMTHMAVGGLLIIARVWRFARVGHGVFENQENIAIAMEGEEDEEPGSMAAEWVKLPDERWDEIRKTVGATPQKGDLTAEELEIAANACTNPAVILRALAAAKAYKSWMDRKSAKQQLVLGEAMFGSSPPKQAPKAESAPQVAPAAEPKAESAPVAPAAEPGTI